jgi:Rrf2 family protein
MFKVSRRADYATRVLLTLASGPPKAILSAAELSAQTDVPQPFLHKVVQDLARTGFVRTIAGAEGGATLLCPAGSITLLDIFQAIEGPLCINVCLNVPGACPRDDTCPAHRVWARVQGSFAGS